MKQYLPLKPVKRGFKVWAMADALNGYVYDFNVYTGACGDRETGLGEKVALTLAKSIRGRHHHLYFDYYFSSISLLSILSKMVRMLVVQSSQITRVIPLRIVMRQSGSIVVRSASVSVVTL